MTHIDRTASASRKSQRVIAWTSAATGIGAVAAVVCLGFTGHTEAAQAAGAIGAAVAAGGITVTVNIRR